MAARIAILGGTGSEGRGLAARLGAGGEDLIIGSRSAERAAATVERLRRDVPGGRFAGMTNAEASAEGSIVVLTVPFEGLDALLEECRDAIGGKIVVDTVVPIRVVEGHFDLEPVAEGSVAEHIQARLPAARVVSAFKNQSAEKLLDLGVPLEGDVVVCGNDPDARAEVSALVRHVPDLRAVDGGDLPNARALERLTALLLELNRRHGVLASFRLTGI